MKPVSDHIGGSQQGRKGTNGSFVRWHSKSGETRTLYIIIRISILRVAVAALPIVCFGHGWICKLAESSSWDERTPSAIQAIILPH